MAKFKPSNVTLLHRGVGPSLFQYRSKPYPIALKDSPECSPRCKTPKKVIVKCADRLDANSMFEKRLRTRDKSARAQTATSRPPTTSSMKNSRQNTADPYIREKMFSVKRKVDGFPPPTFMPRWNPRHMDRTYLDKMILDDPWSLPPDKRRELQRKTGLRLKSISRHYQFKVKANLPFGKDVLDKKACTCYVEFCEHCSKRDWDYRCPLHMQLLEGAEADCKTELTEFCPHKKNPEDVPLRKIKDVDVYVSEVVRRLKAGEITEAPPFPDYRLWDKAKWNDKNKKNAAVETSSALELGKKTVTEDVFAQTEPYMTEVDLSNAVKENLSQTAKPPSDTPLLTTGLTALKPDLPFFAYGNHEEKTTQVTPFMITPYDKLAGRFTRKIAAAVLYQSALEVRNETVIHSIQTEAAVYAQQLMDIQRREHFCLIQEQFRTAAYAQEELNILEEALMESNAASSVEAILYSSLFFRDFSAKAMDSLRTDGYLLNEDLQAINNQLKAELNGRVEEKLDTRKYSIQLLDDIVVHALNDIEMDAFINNVISQSYLDPINWTTRQLVDLIRLHDENLKILEKIKKILNRKGVKLPSKKKAKAKQETGEGEEETGGNEGEEEEGSDSDDSLDAFLQKVRVSVDDDGNPKYLVDMQGRPLPINVVWLPFLADSMANMDATGRKKWDSKKTFDIVLSKESILSEDSELTVGDSSTHIDHHGPKIKKWNSHGEVDISFDDREEEEEDVEQLFGSDDDQGQMIFKLGSETFEDGEALI